MTPAVPTVARLATIGRREIERPDGADLLKLLRVEAGLSQNQLARRAEIDPAYVNRIERRLGRHTPSRSVVLRLVDALELDLDRGDRLLHAFGLAGRIDWQSAWQQLVAELPPTITAATERALADVLRTAVATSEPART